MTDIQQCHSAKAIADHVRITNAATLRHARQLDKFTGADTIAGFIERNEAPFNALRVRHAIMAVKGIGDERLKNVLLAAGVRDSHRRIRELSDRQRGVLAAVVRGRLWTGEQRRTR